MNRRRDGACAKNASQPGVHFQAPSGSADATHRRIDANIDATGRGGSGHRACPGLRGVRAYGGSQTDRERVATALPYRSTRAGAHR